MAELAAHFEDELRGCKTEDEKEQKAQQLINEFGDAKLLGVLLRRAKKRCRPLWRKVLVRSFQAIGVILLYIIFVIVYLTSGTTNISVDYTEWLNEQVRGGRDEADNAKTYYDKAVELYVECPNEIEYKCFSCLSHSRGLSDFNDFEMKHLINWLDDNQKAFEAFRAGTQKPYYWPIYRSKKTESMQEALIANTLLNTTKTLSKYRKIVWSIRWRIKYDTYKGNMDNALDNCLVLQKFGGHLQSRGLLIEQLVGIAIEALANKMIFITLEQTDIEAKKFKRLLEGLQQQISSQQVVIDLEAEKAFWYDLVQCGFTDDGEGSGRVLKEGLPLVIKDVKSSLSGFFFFNYPDRREVVATIDRYFSQVEEFLGKTPYQLKEGGDSQKWDELGKESMMLKILEPAHGKVGQQSWALKTSRAGLLTTLAVLRYKKEL